MNTKRRGLGVLAILTILAALVALPGCFFRGDRGDHDGGRHEEHRDSDRHEGATMNGSGRQTA